MVSNLRLVDPSTATNPKFPDGLEMLAFSAQQHHLPTLRRSGDVIRLHRVTVSYLQLLQLLPGLNPKHLGIKSLRQYQVCCHLPGYSVQWQTATDCQDTQGKRVQLLPL